MNVKTQVIFSRMAINRCRVALSGLLLLVELVLMTLCLSKSHEIPHGVVTLNG